MTVRIMTQVERGIVRTSDPRPAAPCAGAAGRDGSRLPSPFAHRDVMTNRLVVALLITDIGALAYVTHEVWAMLAK